MISWLRYILVSDCWCVSMVNITVQSQTFRWNKNEYFIWMFYMFGRSASQNNEPKWNYSPWRIQIKLTGCGKDQTFPKKALQASHESTDRSVIRVLRKLWRADLNLKQRGLGWFLTESSKCLSCSCDKKLIVSVISFSKGNTFLYERKEMIHAHSSFSLNLQYFQPLLCSFSCTFYINT